MKQLDTLIEQNDRLYDFLKARLSNRCAGCRRTHLDRQEEAEPAEKNSEKEFYTEDELMTIDMATACPGVRSTI